MSESSSYLLASVEYDVSEKIGMGPNSINKDQVLELFGKK